MKSPGQGQTLSQRYEILAVFFSSRSLPLVLFADIACIVVYVYHQLNSIPSPSLNIQTRKRAEGGRPPLAAGGGPKSLQRVNSDDGLSTASCISLTRLQFTVTSIFGTSMQSAGL
jgi:hypothetical protein